jgi:hypothetical protein
MIRIGLVTVAVAALALPAGAGGQPPSQENRKNAAKHCKAMRAAAETPANFAQVVEGLQPGDQVNANGKNAYGQCVRFHARDERNEEARAQRSASRECREMREQNPEAFGRGPEAQWRNLGQCVSQKRRENKAEADQKDTNQVNAARDCRDEQEQDEATFRAAHNGESFAEFYGTDNANNRNAFGKCVSQKAREKNDAQDQTS